MKSVILQAYTPWRKSLAAVVVAALGMVASLHVQAQQTPAPVFKDGARVLFQGDSITDGNRGRSMDPNHILGHGYVFILAAKYGAAFPYKNWTFLNRGVSGDTVNDLSFRWHGDTIVLKPDYLSILIGVNDNAHIKVDTYERVYDRLLNDVEEANPNIQLILCEPFGLPVGPKKQDWATWYAGIQERQKVVARLAAKHHAILVPFQRAFDEACKRAAPDYWIWDGVHPTYAGHQIMADIWMKTVQKELAHKHKRESR
jgi:lysophospholipase L1-like esterase